MGCCQSYILDTDALSSQQCTLTEAGCDENFNDVPLSSNTSPMRFNIIQESFKLQTTHLTNYTISPKSSYSKKNIELAFLFKSL